MFSESDLLAVEIERYSRQIIVPGIGVDGQRQLRDARVLVVGCGGLGSPVVMYLASCGVGRIGLVDFDRVELHNLQRQVVYAEDDVSRHKVLAAAEFARRMNSTIKIVAHNAVLNAETVGSILEEYCVVLDCTDSIATRYLLSDYCRASGKDLICGSVLRWEGQLYRLTSNGPCYRCLFPSVKSRTVSCEEGGVFGPVCGIIGSLQASEAIRLIMGDRESRMVIYDGLANRFTNIRLRHPKKSCTACNRDSGQREQSPDAKCIADDGAEESSDWSLDWNDVLDDFESYLFVDVRSPIQHRMFRVRGSKNIPMGRLLEEAETIRNVQKRVGVVCKRGITAKKGAQMLRNSGVDAFYIVGGIDEFKSCVKRRDKV